MICYYTKDKRTDFYESLSYWSDECGELYYHGKKGITTSELPEEARIAYNTLWTDATASLCYLVEFWNTFGIVLINEFDTDTREYLSSTDEELYAHMKHKAEKYCLMDEFKPAVFILGEYTGCLECHEFIVFLPWNTNPEAVSKIAAILDADLYKPEEEKELDCDPEDILVFHTDDKL